MKVTKADLLWAAISMVIVGVSYKHGALPKGVLLIYFIMVCLFVWHIVSIKKRLKNGIAVYGTVVDYHENKIKKKHGWFPVVKYTTETGREITSVYSVEEREQSFNIGDDVLVCYDPDDPMFFYFSNRQDDMFRDYYRFILFGGIIAVLLAVIANYI
ncbi:MAG: DUF3592 domain-containing protein [Ruminococcus sp.]|nr:DUF3592 domain-containing protein [Ruminococcus sp.]